MKVKLGPYASIFHDPTTGLLVSRGEVKEVPEGGLSYLVKNALKGLHLIPVEESVESTEEEGIEDLSEELSERAQNLVKKPRTKILAEFPFLDDSDKAKASELKTKVELVNFLLEVEKQYE